MLGVTGQTVADLRLLLRHVFNIPADALPVVNGVPVESKEEDFAVPANACLEFVKDAGFKGLGDLLLPDDIMRRWRINEAQYRELCKMGLPTIQLADETRHPEEAVDEWFRFRGRQVPASAARDSQCLNGRERLIVQTLTEAGQELKAAAIARRAGCGDNSSFRATLSSLFKRGILTKGRNGYGLPEWNQGDNP
jgi:hypothetical protein